jgi:hypothetical protein
MAVQDGVAAIPQLRAKSVDKRDLPRPWNGRVDDTRPQIARGVVLRPLPTERTVERPIYRNSAPASVRQHPQQPTFNRPTVEALDKVENGLHCQPRRGLLQSARFRRNAPTRPRRI